MAISEVGTIAVAVSDVGTSSGRSKKKSAKPKKPSSPTKTSSHSYNDDDDDDDDDDEDDEDEDDDDGDDDDFGGSGGAAGSFYSVMGAGWKTSAPGKILALCFTAQFILDHPLAHIESWVWKSNSLIRRKMENISVA